MTSIRDRIKGSLKGLIETSMYYANDPHLHGHNPMAVTLYCQAWAIGRSSPVPARRRVWEMRVHPKRIHKGDPVL